MLNFGNLNLRPSEQLRVVLIFFLVGLFLPLGKFYPEAFLLCVVLVIGAVVFRKYWVVPLAVLCFAVGWSGWRGDFDFRDDVLVSRVGQVVDVVGVVDTAPDVREDTVRAFVKSDKGNFLLIRKQPAVLKYGDEVRVRGVVEVPRNFGDFNYREYLRRWGAQTIIRSPDEFEVLAVARGNLFIRGAQEMRSWFEENVRRGLPDPHATIAVGVLLGVKSELPEWTQDDFKKSGLQHLLVVSGSNVAIVLTVVAMGLARFGRRVVLVGSLMALVWFVLLVGFDAPVLRAAVMGGTVGIAAALGRFSDARTLVLFSSFVIGMANPAIVRSDVGFHLSFAATVGIVLGTPIILHWLMRISSHKYWKLVSLVLAVSCAAQLAVLPILGNSFGEFPVVGVFANLLAEPLVPLAMAGATGVALLGWLPVMVTKMVAVPVFVVLESLLWVAKMFGQVEPLEVSGWVSTLSGFAVGVFAFWGLLSRRFAETWLVKR